MDFVSLKYFRETARSGSIRRASEVLNVTPSSISRSISALEQNLGAPLFERSRQGMRLTPAGDLLARQTHRVFRDFERVRSEIDDLRGLRRGQVTLYGPEGLVAEFLPEAISRFRKQYPEIHFELYVASTDGIIDAIVNDVADIGITFNGPARPNIFTVIEYIEPLCCLVHPDHPLAAGGVKEVSMADIVAYPLALPEASFGLRRMIDEAIAAEGLQVRIALNTNSLELTKRLAMKGDAVAFMPEFMVRQDVKRERLKTLRVSTDVFENARISVCVHRERQLSFAARAFLNGLSDMGTYPIASVGVAHGAT